MALASNEQANPRPTLYRAADHPGAYVGMSTPMAFSCWENENKGIRVLIFDFPRLDLNSGVADDFKSRILGFLTTGKQPHHKSEFSSPAAPGCWCPRASEAPASTFSMRHAPSRRRIPTFGTLSCLIQLQLAQRSLRTSAPRDSSKKPGQTRGIKVAFLPCFLFLCFSFVFFLFPLKQV